MHPRLPEARGQAAVDEARGPAAVRRVPSQAAVDEARGQAAVELVVLLPVVCVLLAGAWQVVLAAQAQWSVSAAARAAARAQAIGADPLPAARRVLPASLDGRVEVDERDDGVAVSIAVPAIVPGIELGTLTARSTFASQR